MHLSFTRKKYLNNKNLFYLMSSLDNLKKNIERVQTLINSMKDKNAFEKEMEVMTKEPEFYEKHPFLIKRMCRGEDMEMINVMLKSIEKVDKGESSFKQTETELGEELAQKFLYPKIKDLNLSKKD